MSGTRVIDAEEAQKAWFHKMNETIDSDASEIEKQIVMNALLALVLSKLPRDHSAVKEGNKPKEITSRSIEMINADLCGEISTPALARRMNVSVSTLTQTFRRDMNILIHSSHNHRATLL